MLRTGIVNAVETALNMVDPLKVQCVRSRVSDPVWYWPDPDPTSQNKPDPDSTSREKPNPDPWIFKTGSRSRSKEICKPDPEKFENRIRIRILSNLKTGYVSGSKAGKTPDPAGSGFEIWFGGLLNSLFLRLNHNKRITIELLFTCERARNSLTICTNEAIGRYFPNNP